MDLSPRQESMLEFMKQFVKENGYPPTIREIGEAVHISSTSVVNYNLNILQTKGYIRRNREISRGVKLVGRSIEPPRPQQDESFVRIPILGVIVASDPSPVLDENVLPERVEESIALARDIVRESGPLYALHVRGNSMIDALVDDGDIVIMKPQTEAKDGDLVAAWLKLEKATTLKRFFWEGKNRVRLQPANPAMDPIYVHPSNLEIQGKVIAVIRQL